MFEQRCVVVAVRGAVGHTSNSVLGEVTLLQSAGLHHGERCLRRQRNNWRSRPRRLPATLHQRSSQRYGLREWAYAVAYVVTSNG